MASRISASFGVILYSVVLGAVLYSCRSDSASGEPFDIGAPSVKTMVGKLEELTAVEKKSDPNFARWLASQRLIIERSGNAGPGDGIASNMAEILVVEVNNAVNLWRSRVSPVSVTGGIFNVMDYGAIGDGKNNDGPAIRAAIAAARKVPGARVKFPAGNFRIGDLDPAVKMLPSPQFFGCEFKSGELPPDQIDRRQSHILLNGIDNLILEGESAEKTLLVFAVPWQSGILLSNAKHVYLKGLGLDYDPLPFTQGRIQAVNSAGSFDVRVDKDFPSPLAPHIKDAVCRVVRPFVDSKEGVVALREKGAPTHFALKNITATVDGSFRFEIDNPSGTSDMDARRLAPGQWFILYGRVRSAAAVVFDAARNCGLLNSNIYSSPGFSCYVKRSGLVEIGNCKIMPRPGTARISASDADGVFAPDNRLGPYIHDTLITRNGDDYMNFLSVCVPVEKIEGNALWLKVRGHANYFPGDRIVIIDRKTFCLKYVGVVEKIFYRRDGVANFLVLQIQGGSGVNVDPTGAVVINLNTASQGGVVLNNQFIYGFRVVMRSSNALISGNEIVNRHNPGFFMILGGSGSWGEGWRANNVTISGNRIDGVGNIFLAPHAGADPKPMVMNEGVYIEDNVISDPQIKDDKALYDGIFFDQRYFKEVMLRGNVYR